MIKIKLLTAPGCSLCKTVLKELEEIIESTAKEFPQLSVETIDISEQPEEAVRYGVISTPALVIGEKFVLSGIPKKATLLKRLKEAEEKIN